MPRRRGVELRKFPYPYRCALALSNDAEFMTPRAFWDIHRLLDQLGLPVTDSVFMYSVDQARSFSYFDGTTTSPSRHAGWLRELMQAGCIDVLHAFGDFDGVGGCTRSLAEAALDELDRAGIRLAVWTNHGSAENTQNVGGSGATYQRGDLPGTLEYHADLTTAYGVRYFWLDFNATNAVGQDPVPAPPRFADRVRRREPQADPLLLGETLRDGSGVQLFQRYRGPDRPDPATLAAQLADEHLDRLRAREEAMVVYQHLGCDRTSGTCVNNAPPYLPPDALAVLEGVASRYQSGELLVTGVATLLRYAALRSRVRWHTRRGPDHGIEIVVESDPELAGPADLAGLSFERNGGKVSRLVLERRGAGPVDVPLRRDGADVVSVPLPALELPPVPAGRHLEG